MRYRADITAGALKVAESRVIAGLLLHDDAPTTFRDAVLGANVLQASTTATAIRIGRLIHARLSLMKPSLWRLLADGITTTATQACLAAAVKHSLLLGDFMDLALREQYRQRTGVLLNTVWDSYLSECRARDPEMPAWQPTTRARLRSTVYQTLAQAGYLDSTRTRRLQAVHIDRPIVDYLEGNNETYVLRCLEVAS